MGTFKCPGFETEYFNKWISKTGAFLAVSRKNLGGQKLQ